MKDRHSCEALRLAAVQGDDAAWAAHTLWAVAWSGLRPAPFDAERCARVVEFLWNDMGEARRLVAEAAELFRAYEAHHRDIAKRTGAKTGREEKADRNARIAEKLERWLAGDGDSPAAVLRDLSAPGEDTLVAHGKSPLPEFDGTMVERVMDAPAHSRPGWWDRACGLVRDFPGVTSREQAERHPDSHQSRFINREPNVRRIMEGGLAEPGNVDSVLTMIGAPGRSLSLADAAVFRLQTPDPRFDPAKPVLVNGYRYTPATEDLCKTN